MIVVACINPGVDRYVSVRGFEISGTNRVVSSSQIAGGKGVNVAIVLARLNIAVNCVVYAGRENGEIIQRKLISEGVQPIMVWHNGAVRTNIKVRDIDVGIVTELNESGADMPITDASRFMCAVKCASVNAKYLVLTGSLPPGCPDTIYRDMIGDIPCALDAHGTALREGLCAAPFFIKPNLRELMQLCGRTLNDLDEAIAAARDCLDSGVHAAILSMGKNGAYLITRDGAFYCPPLPVDVVSTVGAGDSLVAGFMAAMHEGRGVQDAFLRGVACSQASVCARDAGLAGATDSDNLLKQLKLIDIRKG